MKDPVVAQEIEKATSFISRWDQLEIEIGSGNGHFISAYADRRRDRGLLGIESKNKRCGKIEKKISVLKLSNVCLYRGKAEIMFRRLSSCSVDSFHLYFPDPWPKNKHRKRRLLKMPTLNLFHRILKKRGLIYFGSDVYDYYIQVKLLCLLHGGFFLRSEPLPPEALLSLYSRRTETAGKNLYHLVAEKVDSLPRVRQPYLHQEKEGDKNQGKVNQQTGKNTNGRH